MQIPNLSSSQLELLFESFPECLCLIHFDGTFLKANPAFYGITGYKNHELVARPFIDFVHSDDRKFTIEILGRMADGEAACQFENRFRTKNSQFRKVLWNFYAIRQNELFYCSAIDISEKSESADHSESGDNAAEPLSINE